MRLTLDRDTKKANSYQFAPDDIEEVYCWIVSPNCGNVRFKSDIRSTAANALMYVPEPRTCEAAMRALVPAHSNSDP